MTVVLEDGPAAGSFNVARAPYFLRAVITPRGAVDLLDQLDDVALEGEVIHVYEAVVGSLFTWGPQGYRVFICPPSARPGAVGRYRHRPDVDGSALVSTEAWRAWARAQPTGETTVDGVTGKPHGEAAP